MLKYVKKYRVKLGLKHPSSSITLDSLDYTLVGNFHKYLYNIMLSVVILFGLPQKLYAIDIETMASASVGVTNTLPILYINTLNGQPVTSKTEYIKATYWLDVKGNGNDEFESIGSSEQPLDMEIRGRGHSSWKGDKKPYKLKLDLKQSVLSMPKSKHWVLLKPLEGNIAGMALGKLLDMEWTPGFQPVEVVMNGDYLGLYMLGENIRVAKDRVDIYEQADKETNPNLINGGWLVEIDNYVDDYQISFKENEKWTLRVKYHSPESLSAQQKNWLTIEFKNMNSAIYSKDKLSKEWEDYIDLESMAKFFIVQEVIDNPDGFHGSFYLYKDLGPQEKWKAGPLWDLLCYYRQKTDYTFNMKVHYNFTPHWIGEIIQYESFCAEVTRIWNEVYPDKISQIYDIIEQTIRPMDKAWDNDNKRWDLDKTQTASYRIDHITSALKDNIQWFNDHLPVSEYTALEKVIEDQVLLSTNGDSYEQTKVYNLQGILIGTYSTEEEAIAVLPKGLYIINGQKRLIK